MKAKAAADLKAALEAQRVELMGTVEERAALLEAQEKQKRIDYICQRAARRIANQGILRGWTAWQDIYYEQKRQRQLLAGAGARLSKPALAAPSVISDRMRATSERPSSCTSSGVMSVVVKLRTR